ncbi:alanine--tRNA ligase [Candidatus Uhrbacteria bacterium RIFCSPHIGHO2_01_FULL_63_20]|uniref:Alanine--tRNA ligase n=1 Tax=Candidatus Uhrbacteria bacterium RIFCSPHIGHO2_01_FULL_63_20 TaxID=1802385 RepID=A0A1F7TLK7_9BACT|nr:MAG: alanine--tRNA ligase [Candidatus Uhrbacteria bacterium RIFCSPHIGHO2_01_FULL_63_20]
MTSVQIRQKFLEFFRSKGHTVIPSASLVPENDPTVLFTTAGMHPLVPYLLGEKHPGGKRLTDVQKCLRTGDIDDVGDNRHLTFFEMLGNWSLGDYFKKEAIEWSFEFLTGKEWLALDPERLYVSVFEGDDDAPRDEESIELWKKAFATVGMKAEVGERIFPYSKKSNWWGPAGATGPCGPDTEMYYDTGLAHDKAFGEACHPSCDCGRFIEIWNDVFMQYEKTSDRKFVPLKQKNVDTGMGLERITTVKNGLDNVFDTDLFAPIIQEIERMTHRSYRTNTTNERSMRIVADHVRTAMFLIADGILPSNKDQGYVLRRLIRRSVRHGLSLGLHGAFLGKLYDTVAASFDGAYPELITHKERIVNELTKEEEKFGKTLEKGLREFEKLFGKSGKVTGDDAFVLHSTYGFPLELTEEIARDKGQKVDRAAFEAEFRKHQDLSRTGAEQKFAGGLADHSAECTRLHTATHLLHQALRTVLGGHVAQKGSNITRERLRFDFSHPEKMTKEQIKEVEDIVNGIIERDLPVHYEILDLSEAKKRGAIGLFEDTYAQLGGKIKVYFVGDQALGDYVSAEVCGGPHVERTGELKGLVIQKEEAVAAGVRRIKAAVAANEPLK